MSGLRFHNAPVVANVVNACEVGFLFMRRVLKVISKTTFQVLPGLGCTESLEILLALDRPLDDPQNG